MENEEKSVNKRFTIRSVLLYLVSLGMFFVFMFFTLKNDTASEHSTAGLLGGVFVNAVVIEILLFLMMKLIKGIKASIAGIPIKQSKKADGKKVALIFGGGFALIVIFSALFVSFASMVKTIKNILLFFFLGLVVLNLVVIVVKTISSKGEYIRMRFGITNANFIVRVVGYVLLFFYLISMDEGDDSVYKDAPKAIELLTTKLEEITDTESLDYHITLLNLDSAYQNNGEFEESEALLKRLLSLVKKNDMFFQFIVQNNLAYLYFETERYDLFLLQHSVVRDVYENYNKANKRRAKMTMDGLESKKYFLEGEYDKALMLVESYGVSFYVAEIYHEMGNKEKTIETLQKYIGLGYKNWATTKAEKMLLEYGEEMG